MQRIFLGFGLGFALAAAVSGAEIKIDFSGLPPGSSPTNFHGAVAGGGPPGAWQIVMDEVPSAFTALTPQQAPVVNRQAVLAQTSTDPTDEHFPLCIYDGETFKDFKLSTRFKIVSGTAEQMAGMVFRFQNTSNFYVVRVSALGKNIAFYKMVNGEITSPVRLPLEISTGVWHELKMDCSGVYIDCSLDGQKALPTITDKSPLDGKVGFWTKSDAVSYFCGTVIDYTPRIPAAQALVNRTLKKEPRILGLQLYTLDAAGQTHIIASKDTKDIGQPGEDSEKTALTGGKVFFGREKDANVVVMPLRDRNGDPMAAVRLRLKPFIGELQAVAISRATTIVKLMQAEVTSSEELLR